MKHKTVEHSPFDAMILALDAETSAFGAATLENIALEFTAILAIAVLV